MWKDLIARFCIPAATDTSPSVRSAALDCMSALPRPALLNDDEFRATCGLACLQTHEDTDAGVRSSSLHALGGFASLPVFKDSKFVSDLAAALPSAIRDENINVRIRAGWALANLCDCDPGTAGCVVLTNASLDLMFALALHSARDNEKCRSSGVRAIGNILKIGSSQFVERNVEGSLKEAVVILIKQVETGPFKHINIDSVSWREELMNKLVTATCTSKNFKVRINTAQAICEIRSLSGFGGYDGATEIENALRLSLGSIDAHLQDFNYGEFRYKEQLEEQMSRAIDHVHRLRSQGQ
ncbi:armadillo-type protein [Zopfochytrium polystomum]|nr:armadillo-type protein [Zopfochytrium polystomum]